MNQQFAIMWDCYGLEACQPVPTLAERTWATLAEKELTYPQLEHWRLRARYNSQRHYEIWVVEAVDGISAEDIVDMFHADPQSAADTIRRLGNCYYSDRSDKAKVVIE
jgi:hypothetical protein